MEKIKVLLVEDEPTLAMIIKDTLDGNEFDITLAANGEEGLSRYAEINPDNDGTQGLFKSDAARADTVELARGILAYQQWADSGSIEGAIAAAVGGDVEAYNGKKAVMPKGIKSSAIYSEDLGDLVETQAQEVKKARGTFYVSGLAMTGEELAAKMPKLALQTEKVNSDGSVTYSLMLNGESVFGDDGSLYTFDLVKTKE